MKQDVIISIAVKQDFEDSEDEVIELLTQGTMEFDGTSRYVIAYEESEITGLAGTTTTFIVDPQRIMLTRVGAVRSQMEFELGKRHQSAYDTPYGSMDVEVHTRSFQHNISPTGGEITLEYNIEIGKNILGNNFFHIKVSLPKQGSQNKI